MVGVATEVRFNVLTRLEVNPHCRRITLLHSHYARVVMTPATLSHGSWRCIPLFVYSVATANQTQHNIRENQNATKWNLIHCFYEAHVTDRTECSTVKAR